MRDQCSIDSATMPYQDGCRLVTVCAHGDFVVQPHWQITCQFHDSISQLVTYIILTTTACPILLMLGAELESDTYQFCKSLAWLDYELNSRSTTWWACALPHPVSGVRGYLHDTTASPYYPRHAAHHHHNHFHHYHHTTTTH